MTATKRAAAFFDLEQTITADAVEKVISILLYRRRLVSLGTVLRAVYAYAKYDLGLLGDYESLKRWSASQLAGRCASADIALVRELFLEHLHDRIYSEARRRIEGFRRRGMPVFIVSSTYHDMVAPYAELLGVDGYFGVQLEIVDDCWTGRIEGVICHQWHKANMVQRLAREHDLDLARSWAFGDSANDRFMLASVGHPVAVNPDRKLRRLAQGQGWAIERWGELE